MATKRNLLTLPLQLNELLGSICARRKDMRHVLLRRMETAIHHYRQGSTRIRWLVLDRFYTTVLTLRLFL